MKLVRSDPSEIAHQNWPTGNLAWIFRIVLSLGVTFVFARSAISVVVMTFGTAGEQGLLIVISCSLLYSGAVLSISQWNWKKSGSAFAYFLRGLPTLSLGLIALITRLFLEKSTIQPRAYTVRVVLVGTAILSLFTLSRLLCESLLLPVKHTRETYNQMPAETRHSFFASDPSAYRRSNRGGADGQFLLIASYILDSVIWTGLAISYRYFSASFLGQSPWVMASLWLFLISSWANCITVARRGKPLCNWAPNEGSPRNV